MKLLSIFQMCCHPALLSEACRELRAESGNLLTSCSLRKKHPNRFLLPLQPSTGLNRDQALLKLYCTLRHISKQTGHSLLPPSCSSNFQPRACLFPCAYKEKTEKSEVTAVGSLYLEVLSALCFPAKQPHAADSRAWMIGCCQLLTRPGFSLMETEAGTRTA